MPYIKQEDRNRLIPVINDLVGLLKNAPAGEINYVFSTVIWRLFEKETKYSKANELIGVLECIKQEFYRRKVATYEDKKIAENGDVS